MDYEIYTSTAMAAELDVPFYKVNYLIKTHQLQPCGRVGITRVFDKGTLLELRNAITAQNAKRKSS